MGDWVPPMVIEAIGKEEVLKEEEVVPLLPEQNLQFSTSFLAF